jgi:hypothetical protein
MSETISIRSGSPSSSSTRSSSEKGPESTNGTKIEIQDDPDEDPRNEDNITFKVLGSAIVTIAGATIECQSGAEINIVRKKGIRPTSSTPEGSEDEEAEVDHSSRLRDRSRRSSLISSRRDRSPSPPLPFQRPIIERPESTLPQPSVAQLRKFSQQPGPPENPFIYHPTRFVASSRVVYEVGKMDGRIVDEEDESRPTSSVGHRREEQQLQNETLPAPEQRGRTIIIDTRVDRQDQGSDDSNGEIVEENKPPREPLMYHVSHEQNIISSSSSMQPLGRPIRPPSTTTITTESNQSNSDSDDSDEFSEVTRNVHSNERLSESSASWEAISYSSMSSDDIEPSESASRPGVERTPPNRPESFQRTAPDPIPKTPRSSSGSSVGPQGTMTPPMNVPGNTDLNKAQRTSDSDSSFPCTVGMMSADGILQFSNQNYPLDGAHSLHSSVSHTYEAIHGPLMM